MTDVIKDAAMDPAIAERAETIQTRLGLLSDTLSFQAHDLITALLAQNAALRAEVEWWKQDDRAAWDKCEERRIAQEAAEAQIAALTARVEGLTGVFRRLRKLPDEIEQQVQTTRAYAADCGMSQGQIDLMATCTSHFIDYSRTLRAELAALSAPTEEGK